VTSLQRPRASSERRLRGLLLTLGAVQVGPGGWMALAPDSFLARVAPFGVRNDHLLRDLSTVSLALGAAALLTATRPAWRVPVLAITLLQFTFHSLNHQLDTGRANPDWLGPANALVLWLAPVALALTLRAAQQPTTGPAIPTREKGIR
jgi:hypothetical protein